MAESFKKKKRGTSEAIAEPNTRITSLERFLNNKYISEPYKQHIRDVIKDIQEGSPLDLYSKDWIRSVLI